MAKKAKKAKSDNTQSDEAAPAKGGMGLVGQIAIVAVLGITSFATVYLLPRPAPVIIEDNTGKIDPDAEDISAAMDIEIATKYFALEPLTLTLTDNRRTLRIGITLEMVSDASDSVAPDDPKLRDAFTGYLRSLRTEQIEDAAFMAQLRAQLLRRAQIIIGQEAVHSVLITDFLVR